MKRTLFLLFLIFWVNTLSAQSVARVMADTEMKEYKWAVGEALTLEEADKNAMNLLVSYACNITLSTKSTVTESDEKFKQEVSAMANVYLENVRREVLPEQNGNKRVLRYISIEDWNARNNVLKGKIQEYIDTGYYAPRIEDKIRAYAWAYALLGTYHDAGNPILVDDKPAKSVIYDEIREILNDIKVSIIGIENDKTNRNYPYKVFLDFTYNDEPIGYLQFDYFDGGSWVKGESIKDGRGVVLMTQLTPELQVNIDCVQMELARQLDPSVYILLKNPYSALSFVEAQKRVSTSKVSKTEKEIDTTSSKIESVVNEKIKEVQESYVEVKEEVYETAPFEKMMTEITASIKQHALQTIKHHFTADAWSQYERIVASGNPIIARTPEYKFIKHDTITICQSIPLKLRFSGNRSFVEDVVFRVNNKSKKVESVAYKLGMETEKAIMAMRWDDKARLTLIAFLEDYRSAYCLRDLDYIRKVFAEDAYIIVGKVLKKSAQKFEDNPYALNVSTTTYSKLSKAEYVSHLQKCFASKEFVNLRFEECNVAKGFDGKEGVYAVQVRQLYYSNNYADNGILTLAIDMRNEKNPLVRVRVWQQERDVKYNAEQMIEKTVSTGVGLN
jgi:hypothetical protein